MKHKVRGILDHYRYVEADIIDTENGILIEILKVNEFYIKKEEILKDFINSIRELYDTNFNGYNKEDFVKETLLPRKEALQRKLEKIEFIEKIIFKDTRKD